MGGGIKTAEFISGRYADILSNLYMGYACLWFYEQNKHVKGLDKVLELAMADCCKEIQEAFFGLFSNFPVPLMGPVMRAFTFPRGREYHDASDKLRRSVATMITTPSEVRALLTDGVFVSKNPEDRVNQIARALPLAYQADLYLAACRKEKRQPTAAEKEVIDQAEALREQIIQVDVFQMLAGKDHRAEHMKPTWKVEPVEGSKAEAAH
jgi:acyl-CoA dehydrogenase